MLALLGRMARMGYMLCPVSSPEPGSAHRLEVEVE